MPAEQMFGTISDGLGGRVPASAGSNGVTRPSSVRAWIIAHDGIDLMTDSVLAVGVHLLPVVLVVMEHLSSM